MFVPITIIFFEIAPNLLHRNFPRVYPHSRIVYVRAFVLYGHHTRFVTLLQCTILMQEQRRPAAVYPIDQDRSSRSRKTEKYGHGSREPRMTLLAKASSKPLLYSGPWLSPFVSRRGQNPLGTEAVERITTVRSRYQATSTKRHSTLGRLGMCGSYL
jgi:hypothetical protein